MKGRPILFVEHHGQIVGGGQFSLLVLMQGLEHYEPHCVTGGEGSMTEAVQAAGIEGAVVPMPALKLGNLVASLRCVRALCRIAKGRQAAILHANGSRSMFYAGLVGKIVGLPVVWHVRIAESDGWWDRFLASLATRIIAISLSVERRFAGLRAAPRVRLVHNGVDTEVFAHGDGAQWRERLGWGARPLVGMVAQLIPWKRQDVFLRAMALLPARFSEVRFAVVGAEPDPAGEYAARLRVLAVELGLGDRVEFMGFCNDAPGIFAALDIVVLTSENEPFGRVLIEAMAAGRPVVATAGGGVPEIVVDGETGLLVAVGDAEATAAAVGELLADPKKARAMGAVGRERVRAKFSIEAHVRKLEALYADVLDQT